MTYKNELIYACSGHISLKFNLFEEEEHIVLPWIHEVDKLRVEVSMLFYLIFAQVCFCNTHKCRTVVFLTIHRAGSIRNFNLFNYVFFSLFFQNARLDTIGKNSRLADCGAHFTQLLSQLLNLTESWVSWLTVLTQ